MIRSSITLAVFLPCALGAEPLSYNRDIRPILSDKCFHCHGPDKATRKPKSDPMRLDSIEGATQDQGGYAAITPGKPEESELILRIFAKDEDDLMPPPDSHRSLTQKQKEMLRQWIKEGAKYEHHWAFVPPVKAPVPPMKGAEWPKNEIDHFVLARLTEEKLQPTSTADKNTLLRRATLALTGLQPTPQELTDFLADKSPGAYGKMLDRVLASQRYGEHMAYGWIEAARYADTDGYQNDGGRTMWPWRDWVIKAFNDNMPYDQFSIRQLAGDMLPNKTNQDILASAFNRNHRINNEGGALPEEFIVEYAVDRVETTSGIWLGLTAGCARCHDHKYDPLSQKQFFQFYAYFNNIPEKGKAAGANAAPSISIGSPYHQSKKTSDALIALQRKITTLSTTPDFIKRQQLWEKQIIAQLLSEKSPWRLGDLTQAKVTALKDNSPKKVKLTQQADGTIFASAGSKGTQYTMEFTAPVGMKTISTFRLDTVQQPSLKKPLRFSHGPGGNFFLSEVQLSIKRNGKLIAVPIGRADSNFSQIFHSVANLTDGKLNTGWGVGGYKGKPPLTVHIPVSTPLQLEKGDTIVVSMSHASIKNPATRPADQALGNFRISFHSHRSKSKENNHFSNQLAAAIGTPSAKRDAATQKIIASHYLSLDPEMNKLIAQREKLRKTIAKLTVRVPVMQENAKAKPTYLLKRGQYHSPDKSEELQREIPPWLDKPEKQPANRLELARWLVSKDNPLGARVMVNRVWQQHFGVGLVKSADNFGLQGDQPSHQELLDWLAVDFIEHGWDIKRLHKMILMSSTWKQQSHGSAASYEKDPNNRLLSRGPRFRLSAVAIRDTALHAAGLLHEQLGGPPVKPYQPKGLWNSMAHAPNIRYVPSKGTSLYRRDLYTYWKRAVNPPRMILFDAATRDYCSVLRNSTNTPLQALTTMNDITFVEAARHLGMRMLTSKQQNAEAKLLYGFQLATGRHPKPKEQEIIKACFKDFWTYYGSKPKEAAAHIKHGTHPVDPALNASHYAAYMATAHLMLNMDSTLHQE